MWTGHVLDHDDPSAGHILGNYERGDMLSCDLWQEAVHYCDGLEVFLQSTRTLQRLEGGCGSDPVVLFATGSEGLFVKRSYPDGLSHGQIDFLQM
jgi:hypothetical protein